jgi:hypothetical protein
VDREDVRGCEVRLLLCILCLLAAMFLASCGKKPPVVVPTVVREVVIQKVSEPTPVIVQPPAELLQPLTMPPPIFVSPSDPKAVVALTEDEARAFRAWSAEMKLWRDAVLAWWTSLKAQ